jgi:hypothetical protein
MRLSIRIGVLLVIGFIAAGTLSASGNSYVGAKKQWTIVNFVDPVLVKGEFVMGPVMIVHDTEKMEKGEACTTFYRFDKAKGPQEEIVSVHCNPRTTDARAGTTSLVTTLTDPGCRKLVEYQIAGDAEAHGVPGK